MSRIPTYQAAKAVAATIEAHFTHQISLAQERGEQNLAPIPPAQVIAAIIDTTFWASLQREEGHSPKISLAFLPPEQAEQAMLFEGRFPLSALRLTKLAPAVERPGIHLGVWQDQETLYVWGATRSLPGLCFVLEVVEPGLLVIKHRRSDGFGKFGNVAVLNGESVKVVDSQGSSLPDCPSMLTTLLGANGGLRPQESPDDSVSALIQLAVSMRAHGRGGSLLVVPSGSSAWRRSIIHPISYAVSPAFSGLANVLRQEAEEQKKPQWQDTLKRAIDGVAGLTAVDGASVISDQYDLLAFGAKIRIPDGNALVEEMVMTEPIVGNVAKYGNPAQNGGTRHLSAAQFVYDQKDALALVASQDGRFTVFSWSPCEGMVQSHRIDSLLL